MSVVNEFAGLVGAEFQAWLRQMERLGGCAAPVYLTGHTLTRDARTGELLHVFTSASQPYGRFAVGCRNRRELVCLPCSYLHKGDTYQIVVSGLVGGKGVPGEVASHPRVFATLTAPSFGAVHRASDPGDPVARCRVRRGGGGCAHGVPVSCGARHEVRDPQVGSPLCAKCYDYAGAVLWNASVGHLWRRVIVGMPRALAKLAGIRVRDLRAHARISFTKVTEYQHRGSVHLHAVIRVDGPGGPDDPAPSWASAGLLGEAVAAAVAAARVTVPEPETAIAGHGARGRVVVFGSQLDVQQIRAGTGLDGLSDTAVAAYVAKYVTKGDIGSLVLPNRLRSEGQIETTPGLSMHARRLMHAAWALGGLNRYEHLKLRTWAHQVGFRGHILTKSRRYSTTYTALRAARSAFHRPEEVGAVATVTESSWRLDRIGHTPGEAMFARGIAGKLQDARDAEHERARADRRARVGGWGNATAGRASGADRDQSGAGHGADGRP
ncbi:MAG: replication initiator [Sciscionella sp.]